MSIPVPHDGHLTSPSLGDLVPRSEYVLVRTDHARYPPESMYSSSSDLNERMSRGAMEAMSHRARVRAGLATCRDTMYHIWSCIFIWTIGHNFLWKRYVC